MPTSTAGAETKTLPLRQFKRRSDRQSAARRRIWRHGRRRHARQDREPDGSAFDDLLIGDDHANQIVGWYGHDTLKGGGGDDALQGHAGNDVLYGGKGGDGLSGGRTSIRRRTITRRRVCMFPSTPIPAAMATPAATRSSASSTRRLRVSRLPRWATTAPTASPAGAATTSLKGFGGTDTLQGGRVTTRCTAGTATTCSR